MVVLRNLLILLLKRDTSRYFSLSDSSRNGGTGNGLLMFLEIDLEVNP